MTDRPIDVWVRTARSSWQESPWRGRTRSLTAGINPGERPSTVWRFVPLALVALVVAIDAVLYRGTPFLLTALLDETGHLLTTVVVLAGLIAAGARVNGTLVASALVAGNLIDLDHLPQLLGHTWLTSAPDSRPYTHSITTIVVVAVLAHLHDRVAGPDRGRRAASVAAGVAVGLLGHFARDIAGSATALLWPMSTTRFAIPYWLYLTTLLAAAAAWTWQGRWPVFATDPASSATDTRPAGGRVPDSDAARIIEPVGLRPWASRAIVTLATLAYTWHVTAGMLTRLHDLRLAGFDTGIFVQGVWLLSQGQDPFVTVRGLPLLADHASFVLLLLAPLYALAQHPGLLLAVQVLGTASAAIALNALFLRTGRVWPATVFPLLYLLHPAQQWGTTFEFHPESLAPVFLVLGLHLALHSDRRGLWVLPLLVALSCKEDVSFVVAGLGLLLLVLGRRRRGITALGLGLAYFLVVTSVIMPFLGGGMTSIYFQKNFDIDTDGAALGWVPHLPRIVEMFFEHAIADPGLAYLMLVLAPVAFLALLDPKWLLPAAGPLFINLASQVEELHSIQFHYLLTSVPFVVIAAFHGYLRLTRASTPTVRRSLLGIACIAGLVLSAERGALPKLSEEGKATPAATRATAEQAMALIPEDAAVAAGWNMVPSLAHRTRIYDFPVPFDKGWWGKGDPPAELADEVTYVIVRPSVLRDMDRPAYDALRSSPEWRPVVDKNDVVLLHKVSR